MQNNQAIQCALTPTTGGEMPPDEVLVRQAGSDPQAFAELYRRTVQRVYRFHLLRTGNVEDAEDLTSQTFLAALENVERYRSAGSFYSWLLGIASHKVADHYRRSRPTVSLEDAQTRADAEPSPEDVVSTRLRLAQVARALQTLPAEQAEALTLRLFGQLTAAEAGHVMGKSEAAVKMLVHRGLQKLRAELSLEVSL